MYDLFSVVAIVQLLACEVLPLLRGLDDNNFCAINSQPQSIVHCKRWMSSSHGLQICAAHIQANVGFEHVMGELVPASQSKCLL